MAKVRVNWGPAPEGCSVKLFTVWNTNHNCLQVFARDSKTAMSIACTANHVYGTSTKIADNYSRIVDEVKPPYTGAIQLAVARRLEGTVHFEDDQLFVGYEPLVEQQ